MVGEPGGALASLPRHSRGHLRPRHGGCKLAIHELPRSPVAAEPILAQGTVEKAFPEGESPCTERVRFHKAEAGRPPLDDGYPLKRGLAAGALAEGELHRYGAGHGFSIDL